VRSSEELDGAVALWNSLDSHLSALPDLENVTFLMVIESCLGMFMGTPDAFGGMFNKWRDSLFDYAKVKLPLCHSIGRLKVTQVVGDWTGHPFGNDADIAM